MYALKAMQFAYEMKQLACCIYAYQCAFNVINKYLCACNVYQTILNDLEKNFLSIHVSIAHCNF